MFIPLKMVLIGIDPYPFFLDKILLLVFFLGLVTSARENIHVQVLYTNSSLFVRVLFLYEQSSGNQVSSLKSCSHVISGQSLR